MSPAPLPVRVADAFNRHGAFTARVVEENLAVEVRDANTGEHLTTVWLPGKGGTWVWPFTPGSETFRWLAGDVTLEELVRTVATSILDERPKR